MIDFALQQHPLRAGWQQQSLLQGGRVPENAPGRDQPGQSGAMRAPLHR